MAKQIFLIFPHHLFEDLTPLKKADEVFLIEEFLFFKQYPFHQQKIVFHRASMKHYELLLRSNGINLRYIDSTDKKSDIRKLIRSIADDAATVTCYDPCDEWLEKRLRSACKSAGIPVQLIESPLYINNRNDSKGYFEGKEKYFLADFYMQQRKKYKILVDKNNHPAGGKWSFDEDNRLKYPGGEQPPPVNFPVIDEVYEEAIAYTQKYFSSHYGSISRSFIFPYTHAQAKEWLHEFLKNRFADFGPYEDAILAEKHILHHSVLTPMLNTGLLTPKQVINETLLYSKKHDVPLNSLEGFIRQIIGWREFIRAVYVRRGTEQRTTNFWKFSRKIPQSFYNGTTGIVPIDQTIRKILSTGYCHHIERLMILGNFMLLCEFDPDDVYQWFMEMFIDAYDWVMVPNVYGMSQFADGGLMATKPYISAGSYILKMSNYKKGPWSEIWDALFWRFMNKHRDVLSANPRLGMLVKNYDKMDLQRKKEMDVLAEVFLGKMDQGFTPVA